MTNDEDTHVSLGNYSHGQNVTINTYGTHVLHHQVHETIFQQKCFILIDDKILNLFLSRIILI